MKMKRSILILFVVLLLATEFLVNGESEKRDLVNLVEMVEDKCHDNDNCLKKTYKKLEKDVGNGPGERKSGDGPTRYNDQERNEQQALNKQVEDQTQEELEQELDDLRDMFYKIRGRKKSGSDTPLHRAVGDSYQPAIEWSAENNPDGNVGAENYQRFYDDRTDTRIKDWAQYQRSFFANDASKKPETYPNEIANKQDLTNVDKVDLLADMGVRWSDMKSMTAEERVKWKQDMKSKLEVAKAERKRERDELKRQREMIRDRKIELERYQREMLRELEEEISELEEEEKELRKEKQDIDKELKSGLSFYNDTEALF